MIDYGVSLGFGGMMMLLFGNVRGTSSARRTGELSGCTVFRDHLVVDKDLAGNSSAVINTIDDIDVGAE